MDQSEHLSPKLVAIGVRGFGLNNDSTAANWAGTTPLAWIVGNLGVGSADSGDCYDWVELGRDGCLVVNEDHLRKLVIQERGKSTGLIRRCSYARHLKGLKPSDHGRIYRATTFFANAALFDMVRRFTPHYAELSHTQTHDPQERNRDSDRFRRGRRSSVE